MKKIVFLVFLLIVVGDVQAQSECESMLNAAMDYFNKGKYNQALTQFKLIQKDCGSNYGGTADYIRKCNNKIQEDADYQKCTTVEACNEYLEKYPQGRYVKKVTAKRTELLNAWHLAQAQEKEDEEYKKCTTEESCRLYLKHYPNGKYASLVGDKLRELIEKRLRKEEDDAYKKCTTESACKSYLDSYPEGRYVAEVAAKMNELETNRLRKEYDAEKKAYMNIRKIEFANVDGDDNVINSYDSIFYDSDLKFLRPRITYDGILDETKYVHLNSKIITPYGIVMSNANSDYTFSEYFQVRPGVYNKCELSAWGNPKGGYYKAGKYTFELWYKGERLYQTSFIVKAKENALSRGNWRTALNKCNEYVSKTYENDTYKGQLVDGIRTGLGMYDWKEGSYYIGEWQSGSRNGMGMYIIPSSGYHVSNCTDCVYYVGGWSNGTMSGAGSCYDILGNLIYYGHFDGDKPTQTYPNPMGYENYKFECIELVDNNYYIGETFKGKPHGKGIYIWNDGSMWYGEWSEGERDGYGIYMTYSGSVSVGKWKGDTKQ